LPVCGATGNEKFVAKHMPANQWGIYPSVCFLLKNTVAELPDILRYARRFAGGAMRAVCIRGDVNQGISGRRCANATGEMFPQCKNMATKK
jgi:hypothetical protein